MSSGKISSSTLKWIAIISMVIDHFAASLYRLMPGYTLECYRVLRGIGRIAFPIYCFLLVEGFFQTHDVRRYIGRCFLFALISEIPFDMALRGIVWYPGSQNVYFTLTLGLCTLAALEYFQGSRMNKQSHSTQKHCVQKLCMQKLCMQIACIAVAAVIAQIGDVDYHYRGILYIVMFYYCRRLGALERDIVGAIAFGLYEVWAPLAFIPIHLYNGQRGLRLKYFFYWVYPVHLLILGSIRMWIMN